MSACVVTTINDDTADIYAAITGDQVALTNIRIEVDGEETSTEWLEPVPEEEYRARTVTCRENIIC